MEESQLAINDLITQTINSLFGNLFASIDNNLYAILDDITFLDTNLLENSYFEKIFGTSTSNGILLIANSLLIGFVLYYCVKLLLANFSLVQVERPYQFLLKAIIFGIAMNGSYFLCSQLLTLNFNISSSICELGKALFHKDISFSGLIDTLNSIISIEQNAFSIFSMDGLIKAMASIGLFNLVFSYSLRYIMVKVFVLMAPFAFLTLLNTSTSWFFRTWFKSFLSLLLLQVLVSLILLVIFSIDFNLDLFSKFIYIGSIYALMKANSYIKDLLGGISTQINNGISAFKNRGGLS